MDLHFNFSVFHLPFPFHNGDDNLNNAGQNYDSMTSYQRISMDDFLQKAHEYGLPDDTVISAATKTWDFFGLGNIDILNDDSLCVYTNNPEYIGDEILGFCRDQMMEYGVHSEDALSLLLSHEAGHVIFEYALASGYFTPWEDELCCDALIGVRAAMEHIDPTGAIEVLEDSYPDRDHPYGEWRGEYIRFGYDLIQEMEANGEEITLEKVLQAIDEKRMSNHEEIMHQENDFLRANVDVLENCLYASQHDGNRMALEWTKSEIDSHLSEVNNEIERLKSLIRNTESHMADRASHGLPTDCDQSTINRAKIDLENELKKKSMWENTKPKSE